MQRGGFIHFSITVLSFNWEVISDLNGSNKIVISHLQYSNTDMCFFNIFVWHFNETVRFSYQAGQILSIRYSVPDGKIAALRGFYISYSNAS